MTSQASANQAPSQPPSQPLRALALLAALLVGWLAARLPATFETHSRLAAAASPSARSAIQPAAAPPAPQPAAAPAIQLQPIYIEVPTPAAAAPQIIHIHHYGPNPEATAPAPQLSYNLPTQQSESIPLPKPAIQSAAPPNPTTNALATAAYEKLNTGNKREALRLFEAALASDNSANPDPRRNAWQQQAKRLKRRWSGEAFALIRNSPPGIAADPATGLLTGPLLGGSQSGAALGYTLNPLARRPVTLSARLNAATDAAGRTDPRTTQAAFGIRYQALPALAVTAERLVSLGENTRDDWLLRLSSGFTRQTRLIGQPLRLDAYGEASLLGNGDSLAAGQARAMTPLLNTKILSLSAGLGSWASIQNTDAATVGRLDVGPSAAVRLGQGRLALELSADYRQRVAGEALPSSGPTLTLSSSF
jgi:hypothetical protein